MAFKSEAHRRKLKELVTQGMVTQEEYDKHEKETPHGIPDRLEGKPKPKTLLRKKHYSV